jgi:ABC-type branched-subunit amino acid transport system substrate-binding protein
MKNISILKIVIIFLMATQIGWGSSLSLSAIEQYAKTLPEFPPNESDNYLNPDYRQFQKSITPGLWEKLLNHLRGKQPFWTKELLMQSMETVLHESPYVNKELIYLTLKPGDQLVVWGELHGAFHSLLRSLNQLKADGFIDDSLKIKKPTVKLIFMGGIIDRSAYSLETLMLVLTLMLNNPKQVIYMRGSHENQQNWLNYDFKREIAVRLNVKGIHDPFVIRISKFFDALPTKIFAKVAQPPYRYLVFNSLYTTPASDLLKINPEIDALLFAQSRSHFYQSTQGLNFLPPEQGIPTWTLFSSPSISFQKLYHFYNDNFSIINIGPTILSSTITLHSRDVRLKSTNFKRETFQIASSQPLKKGEHPEVSWLDLTLASPLDLTGSLRILGQRIRAGIDLRVRKLNREGGINGKLLKIYFENDHNIPSKTLKVAEALIKRSTNPILLDTLGTATTVALLPLIEARKLLVLFPFTGNITLRNQDFTNLVHFRPSNEREIRALIKYAKEKLLKQRFAIFYSDTLDEQKFDIAKKMLEDEYKVPSNTICKASYPQGTINVDSAVNAIKQCSPDVIILLSSYDAGKELVKKIGVAFLKDVTLMGYSYLTDIFRDFVGQSENAQQQGKGLEFMLSRVVPDPKHDQSDIVKEYRKEMDRVYPSARYDVDSLEGYIDASILIDVLKKLEPPYTMDKIIHEIESMKSYPFHGLTLNFDPATRALSKEVWIDTCQKHWIPIASEK